MDPYKILEDQYQQQLSSVESMFGGQHEQLLNAVREQENMLAERYNLERRYVEQTPLDWEQQRGKIQELNKKYEMKMLELKQKVAPHFQELDAQKMQATAKLNQGRTQRQTRLQLIDELVQNGTIKRPEAAIKEQMQTLGLPVSLSDLIGVSREAQIDELRDEFATVSSVLKRFEVDKRGMPIAYDMTGRALQSGEWAPEDMAPVTPELAAQYPQLKQRQAELLKDLSTALTQKQQERPGLYQFSGPTDRVGARRGGKNAGTFQNQAAQLVPQQKKQVTTELVQSLAAQGLNRQQAEQWLRSNGYNVRS